MATRSERDPEEIRHAEDEDLTARCFPFRRRPPKCWPENIRKQGDKNPVFAPSAVSQRRWSKNCKPGSRHYTFKKHVFRLLTGCVRVGGCGD